MHANRANRNKQKQAEKQTLFLLTFGVEQYYRYHVSNMRSLDGKEHSYYIYPDMSLDSVLNRIRENYDISGELDLRWHMRLRVFTEPKPGYYVFPAEMGDKLFISKLQTGDQTPIQLKWTNMEKALGLFRGIF